MIVRIPWTKDVRGYRVPEHDATLSKMGAGHGLIEDEGVTGLWYFDVPLPVDVVKALANVEILSDAHARDAQDLYDAMAAEAVGGKA